MNEPSTHQPSKHKRSKVVYALRQGTVPRQGLELFAVGLERFERAIDEELERAATSGAFKAVRGEYGSGKTFFASWLEHRALSRDFATSVVQIAQSTPLYRMETIYRQMLENMQTREHDRGAFKQLVDGWFYTLEEEVIAEQSLDENDSARLAAAVGKRLEERLSDVSHEQPELAVALRAMYQARAEGDVSTADNLLAWLMAKENVGPAAKRKADLKGDIGHRTAAGFLRGLLALLRQTGRKGIVLVLDELETLMRVRRDQRSDSLESLRKLVDDVGAERYPGLFVVVTGTPAFFDAIRRDVPALAQRLETSFDSADPRFDNPRAPQIRLAPFDLERLVEVGRKVRDIFPAHDPERMRRLVPDSFLRSLAQSVAGGLGGRVGVAPRLYLRELVGGVLDRVDLHPDFDPAQHYRLKLDGAGMTAKEREAAGIEASPDDVGGQDEVELDLSLHDHDDGGIE
ncbi:MAG: BREX system ATP-binding protein BrxD [Sandaracinaceae bacterium]|nr:BREX system ATP-binding protein BrxD [Sandaracinaceae bacterium]